MQRNLTKKNKVKYSSLLIFAQKEDWEEAEMSGVTISVPIVSRKNGRILSYADFLC